MTPKSLPSNFSVPVIPTLPYTFLVNECMPELTHTRTRTLVHSPIKKPLGWSDPQICESTLISCFPSPPFPLFLSIAGQIPALVTTHLALPLQYTQTLAHLWPESYLAYLPKYGWQTAGAQKASQRVGEKALTRFGVKHLLIVLICR